MASLAVQLWTFRNQLASEPAATLRRIASLGIEAVEPYGIGDTCASPTERLDAARQLRASLDAAGLAVCSAHASSGDETAFEELRILGTDTLVLPDPDVAGAGRGWTETPAGVARFAAALDALAQTAAERGVRVGFHNHATEWARLDDGHAAWDLLWEQVDERVIAEVDIYWAAEAGQDPVAVVERLGGRVTHLHLKDRAAAARPAQAPAGHGVFDIDAVLAAAGAARWWIVEFDEIGGDVFAAVETSARWLAEWAERQESCRAGQTTEGIEQ